LYVKTKIMSFQKHLFNSTGIKFGFGIYLTESEASAVHYSQPRNQALTKDHYLYTVEIPDLTDDNHLVSAKPVHPAIIQRTEAKRQACTARKSSTR